MSAPCVALVPLDGGDAVRIIRVDHCVDVRVWHYPRGCEPEPTDRGMRLDRIQTRQLIQGLEYWLRNSDRRSA